MSRVLAVPAVLCVVVGALLGVWGWSERDQSRNRVDEEQADEEVVEGGLFGSSPDVMADLEAEVCATLLSATRLDPAIGPLGPGGPTLSPGAGTTFPPSPELVAAELEAIIQPALVSGLPSLDRPDIRAGILAQRDAVLRASRAGRDITSDPEVAQTALSLGQALDQVC